MAEMITKVEKIRRTCSVDVLLEYRFLKSKLYCTGKLLSTWLVSEVRRVIRGIKVTSTCVSSIAAIIDEKVVNIKRILFFLFR